MSGYWTGKKRPDISEKIAESNRNRAVTDETKRRMSEAHKGSKSYMYKGGLPSCMDCNKQLSRYDAKRCKSCSIAGELNRNYRADLSDEQRLDNFKRMTFKKTIQPLVLARDNYTCQICDASPKYLHVDHIKRWRDYPELRHEIDNCRTVCRPCHYYITFKRKMPSQSQWGLTKAMIRKAG